MTSPETTPERRSFRPRRRALLFALVGIPVLAAGVFTSPVASAAFEAGAGEGRGARMCAKLECTDDQEEELRAIFAEMRQDAKGDREAIERLRAQMKTEFAKDKLDEAKLRQLQEQIATHHKELASRRLDAMLDVHGVLDSGQRKKLIDMMEHRKQKRGEHRKGRRGNKPAKKAE